MWHEVLSGIIYERGAVLCVRWEAVIGCSVEYRKNRSPLDSSTFWLLKINALAFGDRDANVQLLYTSHPKNKLIK